MNVSDDIYGRVVIVLVGALNVDREEIAPDSTLTKDLGAESIDMLDIQFRLEREFNIRIPHGELFPESIFRGDPDLVQEGKVTEAGMSELRGRMPYADLRAFDDDRRVSSVPGLFTVDLLQRYINWKLARPTAPGSEPKVTAA
jgi:acyl carrier protein